MQGRYDRAELLVALWRLGAGDELMPTSHGVLDRALEATSDDLPLELSSLTFSATAVGLRCNELPDILLAAQEAMLTSEPNPTYLSTVVTLGRNEAAEIAIMHGISPADAIAIGERLYQQVRGLQNRLDEMEVAAA